MRARVFIVSLFVFYFAILVHIGSAGAYQEQNSNERIFSDGKQAVGAFKTKDGLNEVHIYNHLSDGKALLNIPQLSVFRDSKNSLVVMVFMDAVKGSFLVLVRGNLIAEKETILDGQVLKPDNGQIIDNNVHALGVIEEDRGGIAFIFAQPKSEDQIALVADFVTKVDDLTNIVTNPDPEDLKLKSWLKNWAEFLPVLKKNWAGPVLIYGPAKATIAALAF